VCSARGKSARALRGTGGPQHSSNPCPRDVGVSADVFDAGHESVVAALVELQMAEAPALGGHIPGIVTSSTRYRDFDSTCLLQTPVLTEMASWGVG
jgi:hypothetical protein